MASAEYVLDSLTVMDHYVNRMAKASEADDVVEAVQAYLASWPAERIARVQKVDADWAPFDQYQRPAPVFDANDVRQICASVNGQRMALTTSGIEVTPELLELDLFFFIASLMLENLDADLRDARASRITPRRESPALQARR